MNLNYLEYEKEIKKKDKKQRKKTQFVKISKSDY